MRESYKRFVKTWIRFANPWIHFVSWSRILTPKRFVLFHDHKSWIRIVSWITNPAIFKRFILRIRFVTQFSKDSTNPHESLVLWHETNPYESTLADSRIRTLKIRFVDSFRRLHHKLPVSWFGFVEIFSNTRFVDSIRKTKNLKRFDLFCFGRIRIRIPHPYYLNILGSQV